MHKEDPTEMLLQIEMLFQKALEELRATKDTEIDCENLLELVAIYEKHYKPDVTLEKRWKEYTAEMLDILEESIEEQEDLMQNIMARNAPIKAYEKAAMVSNNSTEDEEE